MAITIADPETHPTKTIRTVWQLNNVCRIKVNALMEHASTQPNFAMENSTVWMMNMLNIAVSISFETVCSETNGNFTTVLVCWWFAANSTEKARCDALDCSYMCKVTPDGARCFCPTGQEPNGTKCLGRFDVWISHWRYLIWIELSIERIVSDVDECLIGDICDHHCRNTNGSFECYCSEGYMKINNTLCQAINCKSYSIFVSRTDTN